MPRHWIPVFAGMTTGRDPQVCNFRPTIVYAKYTVRTKVEIDDSACAEVVRRYRLTTKREAINLALQTLTAEAIGFDETKQLRGSG